MSTNTDVREFPAIAKASLCVLVLVSIQALVLHLMGQPSVSTTHSLMLWAGDVNSAENSQQLSDWYTFSHIIHGFIFYGILRYFFPKMPIWKRLIIAIAIESAWEIAENTPMVIDHYRQQALAAGYAGDSVINSVSDTIAMMAGFFFAMRAPVWVTVTTAVVFEVFTGYMIHDNLTLNIIGMLWTPDFIAKWQQG